MKRVYVIIVFAFTFLNICVAEELRFYYIAHDSQTNEEELRDRLEDIQKVARGGTPTIFYFANLNNPLVAMYNVIEDQQDTNGFRKILSAMNEAEQHRIRVGNDLDKIISIFQDYKIVDGKYSKIDLTFFLTQESWSICNESLIASLYFILDLTEWNKTEVSVLLFNMGETEFLIDEQYPFGKLNIAPQLNNIYKVLSL